jgi:hypothetical protein
MDKNGRFRLLEARCPGVFGHHKPLAALGSFLFGQVEKANDVFSPVQSCRCYWKMTSVTRMTCLERRGFDIGTQIALHFGNRGNFHGRTLSPPIKSRVPRCSIRGAVVVITFEVALLTTARS